jgi:Xaa-Pro aminopeptidase
VIRIGLGEERFMSKLRASSELGFFLSIFLAAPGTSGAQIWQVDPEIKDQLRVRKLDTILLQALKDEGIDLWLVFDRDADDERVNIVWEEKRKTHLDPVSEHIGSIDIYQPAAFLFTPDGARVAIVSRTDQERIVPGLYSKVVTYEYTKRKGFEDIFPLLRAEVERIAPKTIGINWSKYEPMADGLSLGMFRLLEETLNGLAVRFVSAENVVVSVLGRNTPEEVAHLQESAEISHRLMEEAFRTVRVGETTERDLFNFIRFRMQQLGVEPGWNEERSPIVTFQGPRSGRVPGEERAEPGRLLKINGGVRVKGLSIDLNRNAYVLRPGETAPPPKLQHMWDTVVKATEESVKAIRVGVRCQEVDALARRLVKEAGYEEWGYELAHSVGTWIHGIGPTLGPDWSHFANKTAMTIQVNDAYAVEPAVEGFVPELNATVRVHVQEMVVVRTDGAHYMVPPQTKLLLIRSEPSAPSTSSASH